MKTPHNLLIVDDSTVIRNRVARLISSPQLPHINIAGLAANGALAVELARESRPTLITMDLTMPLLDGEACIEQIIGFLREADAGMAVKDLCRRHGFSEASYYLWRSKFGGMSVSDAKRLKELEAENTRLKKLLAEQMFENDVIKDVLRKKP